MLDRTEELDQALAHEVVERAHPVSYLAHVVSGHLGPAVLDDDQRAANPPTIGGDVDCLQVGLHVDRYIAADPGATPQRAEGVGERQRVPMDTQRQAVHEDKVVAVRV